jgi:AcrR family transcriptional regulator
LPYVCDLEIKENENMGKTAKVRASNLPELSALGPDIDQPIDVRQRPALMRARNKRSRAEKSDEVRRALFRAAARVVGKYGYADASVARITDQAGVAQGTFYNHFVDRQTLLDQLLPALGKEMIEFIRQEVGDWQKESERERKRFLGYFTYLLERPEFYRILTEADLFAPRAHHAHMKEMASGYLRVLERAQRKGELRVAFTTGELEAIAYMLLGIREYLSMRYSRHGGRVVAIPAEVVSAFMKLVTNGLFRE